MVLPVWQCTVVGHRILLAKNLLRRGCHPDKQTQVGEENLVDPDVVVENLADPVVENLADPVVENLADPVAENLADPVAENLADPIDVKSNYKI